MDDVTIEDEFDSTEDISSQSDKRSNHMIWFSIVQILSQQWISLLIVSVTIAVVIYLRRNRQYNVVPSSENSINRYEEMELARQRQQKQYEEQALRREQERKHKMESLQSTTTETSSRVKYRSNDHNPLTGQSSKGENSSCSWRPSSRKPPAGG